MNWEMSTLADVVELKRGYDLASSERIAGDVPVVSAGSTVGTHNVAKVRGPGFAVGRATNLGVPQWSDIDYWPLNTTLYAADFRGNNPRWLYHLFQVLDLTGYDSGSVQPMLNRNYISHVPVAVPSRTEQDAIVEVLGALDDKIAANRRIVQVGQDYLSASWMRIARAPSRTVAWEDVVDINPATPTAKVESVAYLDMKNLPQGGLLVESWGSREPRGGARFVNGDTLLARITPCFENGKAGYVDFLKMGEVGYGSTEYIVFRPHSGIPSAVPFCVATSSEFREHAARSMTGTSGRQRVQARDLGNFVTQWPSEADLNEFGEMSVSLLARLGAARDENRLLALARDELLPLLMDGRISVRHAADAVAAAL